MRTTHTYQVLYFDKDGKDISGTNESPFVDAGGLRHFYSHTYSDAKDRYDKLLEDGCKNVKMIEILQQERVLLSYLEKSQAPVQVTQNCKLCGCKMVWVNPYVPGHFQASSRNYEDWGICHDCMVDHCTTTTCSNCNLSNHSNCHFFEVKRLYVNND